MNRGFTSILRTGALGVALLAAMTANASGTTSTTLPPGSPTFSPATAACIKKATLAKKQCKFQVAVVDCTAQFITDFSNCFAAGKGVGCASSCASKKDTCSLKVTTDKLTCTKGCKKSSTLNCKATCTTNAAVAKQKCTTGFNACITKCQNL